MSPCERPPCETRETARRRPKWRDTSDELDAIEVDAHASDARAVGRRRARARVVGVERAVDALERRDQLFPPGRIARRIAAAVALIVLRGARGPGRAFPPGDQPLALVLLRPALHADARATHAPTDDNQRPPASQRDPARRLAVMRQSRQSKRERLPGRERVAPGDDRAAAPACPAGRSICGDVNYGMSPNFFTTNSGCSSAAGNVWRSRACRSPPEAGAATCSDVFPGGNGPCTRTCVP